MTLSSVQHFRVCFRGLRDITETCGDGTLDMKEVSTRCHKPTQCGELCHVVTLCAASPLTKKKGKTNYKLTLTLESVRHTSTSGNTYTCGLHLKLWCGMQISTWFSFRQVRQSCDDRLDVLRRELVNVTTGSTDSDRKHDSTHAECMEAVVFKTARRRER